MKKISKGLYFNQIEVKLNSCGVFSEKADACIVPQYRNGVSLTGTSAAFIHSSERSAIIAFQKLVAKRKELPYGETCVSCCQGKNYRILIQIPVLDAVVDDASFSILSALKKADNLELRKVVIPAVSSAVLSDEKAAEATFKAIVAFTKEANYVRQISLNINEKATYMAYEKYFSENS